jgi:hypothetical protein
VNNLREGGSYIFHSFMEAAGFTVGRARAYTGAAANLAGQVRVSNMYSLSRLVNFMLGIGDRLCLSTADALAREGMFTCNFQEALVVVPIIASYLSLSVFSTQQAVMR